MPDRQFETYFAPALMPDGSDSSTEVEFGRGNVNKHTSNVHNAFARVPTPEVSQHLGILENLTEAAGGEPITRKNAAQVLGRAVELAAKAK
jgi:hypothetical protein